MILRPQYTQRPLEILIVGTPNSGKRTLAKQLIKCRDTYITTSTAERFKTDTLRALKFCDYVLILVDLMNRQSLDILRQALGKISPQYLTDRCAIIVTKIDAPLAWMMAEDEIQTLIELYAPDIYTFRTNLTDTEDLRILCDRIARIIRTAALQQKGVTTALVKSAVYYNQLPYSARSMEYDESAHSSFNGSFSRTLDQLPEKNAKEDSKEAIKDESEEDPDKVEDEDAEGGQVDPKDVIELSEDDKTNGSDVKEQQTAQ